MRPTHLRSAHRFDLTDRQSEVLRLIAKGRTNAQIADELGITLDGAKYHVREILGKLGVESRDEAAAAWRAAQRPAARLGRVLGALAGSWRLLVGGGAAVLTGVAVLVVVVAMRDGGDVAPAIPDTATPTATSQPATATATPAGCTVTPVLEGEQDGDDVILRLRLSGDPGCQVLARGRLAPGPRDLAPGPPADAWANTERQFKLAFELPVQDPVITWRWRNQCSPTGPSYWTVTVDGLTRISLIVGGLMRPTCVAPGAPMILTLEAMATGADGEVVPGDACADRVAGWLCEFATRVAGSLPAGGLEALVADGETTTYRCGPDGQAMGFEDTRICEGRSDGEQVTGYPLALHGSHGGPRSPEDLVAELGAALAAPPGPAPYLAAIGCVTGADTCETFILAFATRTQPAVAYLVFRLTPGHEPVFTGAGLSGDNAEDILAGRETQTAAGPAAFVALRPPA
ncbi:MAG: helix-turn-helix transcriptional regulator [Dehalococcoidia bacterium]|nr:helix-turn-helix transcriptional regulator [Dehalococcoidia bacterium]